MASTIDSTSIGSALKRIYTPKKIASLVFDKAPGMALVPKNTDLGGELKGYAVRVSEAPLATADVAQAFTNSTAATPHLKQWQIAPVSAYAIATIDHKTMMSARSDSMAFVRAGEEAAESALLDLRKQLGHSFYRAGWGKIGQIAGVDGATITLTNPDDVALFNPTRDIVFSESESGHVLRDSGQSLKVLGRDFDTGVVTFTENVSEVSGVTTGDICFIKGNRENSATPTRRLMSGLDAWLPASAPASNDSFHGVNRSSDSLLAGCRVAGSLTAIEDSLVDGASQVGRRDGSLDVYLVSFNTYTALIKNQSSQIVRNVKVEAKEAQISFEGVALNTSKGLVKIVPDLFCPDGVAYGLSLKTWELGSMGPLVGEFTMDGNKSMRQAGAMGIEIRYFTYPQLVCLSPGHNVRVSLAG